ncbi:MAG: hypothetical protein M3463_20430, partial [Verrucomicrobiota bacterium]|nr:hypothetical protein [Verrucomicrobiota bacterium]
LDWASLPGLWRTFLDWARTGVSGETGHEKEWHSWLELMARYEWPALAGLASIGGLARPGANRLARYLAIYGVGALVAYSLIPYKTPWCLMSLLWPFLLLFGLAADRLLSLLDRWTVGVLVALLLALSLLSACDLNYRKYTSEAEPYVYVQTLPDMYKLVDPLRRLVAEDPIYYQLAGRVLTVDHHPLAWLLGDFTRIDLLQPDEEPEAWDGAWLLIDETLVERAESKLTGSYFKDIVRIRGNAAETSVLYLNVEPFARLFPGRTPELQPGRDVQISEPSVQPPSDVPAERAP